jgi:hypothetical protein
VAINTAQCVVTRRPDGPLRTAVSHTPLFGTSMTSRITSAPGRTISRGIAIGSHDIAGRYRHAQIIHRPTKHSSAGSPPVQLIFTSTKSRRNFYAQCQSFHARLLGIRSAAARRRALKRDERGAHFFLHQQMGRAFRRKTRTGSREQADTRKIGTTTAGERDGRSTASVRCSWLQSLAYRSPSRRPQIWRLICKYRAYY